MCKYHQLNVNCKDRCEKLTPFINKKLKDYLKELGISSFTELSDYTIPPKHKYCGKKRKKIDL